MPSSLDYARPERSVKSLALPAFICGICSGPVAVGLALGASRIIPADGNPDAVAEFCVVAVLAGALVFGCVARAKLPAKARVAYRRLANAAIVAPLGWSTTIGWLVYLLSQGH